MSLQFTCLRVQAHEVFAERDTIMAEVRWERYPHIGQTTHARAWLQIQANLGLAPNTIDAYARALEQYLELCSRSEIVAEVATKEHISWYVHDLMTRPNLRGEKSAVLELRSRSCKRHPAPAINRRPPLV